MDITKILSALDLDLAPFAGEDLAARTPIDGAELARLKAHSKEEIADMVGRADAAFQAWRLMPAPRRGELVRLFGEELRAAREPLGQLVTVEAGKILAEGLGEVQEM